VVDTGQVDDMTGAPATGPAIGPRRLVLAWVLAIVGQAALTALLRVLDPHLTGTALHAMLYLSLAVAVALVGGRWPAVVAAVLGALLLNFFFIPRGTP
jgi:two-component system, OmpR family, sensor histidine kinase KdpD